MKILSYGKNEAYHCTCDECEAEFEFTDIDIRNINKSIDFDENLKYLEVYNKEPYIRFINCPVCGKIILLCKR